MDNADPPVECLLMLTVELPVVCSQCQSRQTNDVTICQQMLRSFGTLGQSAFLLQTSNHHDESLTGCTQIQDRRHRK